RRAQRLVELDARHLLDVGPDPRGLLPELGQELGVDAARHHDALGLALAQGLEDGVAAVDEHLREYTYAPAGRDAAARAAPPPRRGPGPPSARRAPRRAAVRAGRRGRAP